MMNSKKGLSDIVTNVLIILLVLVAVSIIWVFLRPTIQQGAGSLGGSADCLTVQLEPVSCTAAGVLTVRRGAGAGTLSGVTVVYGNNVQTFSAANQIPKELQTVTLTNVAFAGQPIRVAAVVSDGQGGTKTCGESSVEITCASP